MDESIRQSLAEELNVDPDELTADKVLQDIEAWDSVAVLSVLVILSQALNKEISPVEMLDLRTVGDIEALIARKTA